MVGLPGGDLGLPEAQRQTCEENLDTQFSILHQYPIHTYFPLLQLDLAVGELELGCVEPNWLESWPRGRL